MPGHRDGELRGAGAEGQQVAVAGVDPPEQRIDEPLVDLVTQAGAHERSHGDVGTLDVDRVARQDEVGGGPREAARRQHA